MMKDYKLGKNEKMASLDVIALFPSITPKRAKYTVENLIKQKMIDIKPEELEDFRIILNFLLEQNYVKERNVCFEVKMGLPIGGSISSILAEMVMAEFDLKMMNGPIKKYMRYVDDIFIIYNEDETSAKDILDFANSWNKDINFTMEEEKEDRTLDYLDWTLQVNKCDMIKIKTYRKECATNRYIVKESCQGYKIKMNSYGYFIRHAIESSQPKQDLMKVKELMRKNGYTPEEYHQLK